MRPSYRWALALVLILGAVAETEADHGPHTWQATRDSVVKVLPTWPGFERPGFGAPDGVAPEGAGFYWRHPATSGSTDLIVTAAHVVRDATRIEIVTAAGDRVDAEVIGIDSASDVALLQGPMASTGLSLGKTPVPGTHVCAFGNPFGVGISMSCGVVSAPIRNNLGMQDLEAFIQTDAAINPGSSGGPLVNARGQVVGLITVMFSKKADIDAGVNFAVSAQLLRQLLHAMTPTPR